MGRHDKPRDTLDFDEGDLKYNKALASNHFDSYGRASSNSIFNMRKADWNVLTVLSVVGLVVRFFNIAHPDSVV